MSIRKGVQKKMLLVLLLLTSFVIKKCLK